MTANLKSVLAFLFSILLAAQLAWAEPASTQTVNINQADAASIALALTGVGESRAQAIVDWRETHGPFRSVEDLLQVKGIGQTLLSRNQDRILLE